MNKVVKGLALSGVGVLVLVLIAFAQVGGQTGLPSQTQVAGCMQTAARALADGYIAQVDAYLVKIRAALDVKRNEFVAAWGLEDARARGAALEASARKYSDTIRNAQQEFSAAVKPIASQFESARQACLSGIR